MTSDHAQQSLTVRFTEQQIAMLEQFRARLDHNATLEEVVVDLFRQYAERTLRNGDANR